MMRPMNRSRPTALAVLAILVAAPSAGQTEVWDQYNLAPASRMVSPVSVFKTNGNVINPGNVLIGQATAIVGSGAYITLDFGKEVGGYITLTFTAAANAVPGTYTVTVNGTGTGASNQSRTLTLTITP